MSGIIYVAGPRADDFGYGGPAFRKILAATLEGLTDPEDRRDVESAQAHQLLSLWPDEGSLRIAAAMLDGARRLTDEVTESHESKRDAGHHSRLPGPPAAVEAWVEAPERGPGGP